MTEEEVKNIVKRQVIWDRYDGDPHGILIVWNGTIHKKKEAIVWFVKENGNKFVAVWKGEETSLNVYSVEDELLMLVPNSAGWFIQKTHWDNVDFDDEGKMIFKGVDKYGMG